MKLRIGSRKSDLARIQAYSVGAALKQHDPSLQIEYVFKSSLGDLNQTDPLWKMPEKGVFTEDLTRDLQNGDVDLVVHSWKDLPTEERKGTAIVGTLPRADVRDLLLFKKTSLQKLKDGIAPDVFTSSPRRIYNLKQFLPSALPYLPREIRFRDIRGNIATRIKKFLSEPSVDGFVVAKAAIDRILTASGAEFSESHDSVKDVLNHCVFMVLPVRHNPAAAAQGALAIECKLGHQDVLQRVEKINCEATFSSVQKEREILRQYGGGCHQKIGVAILPRPYGVVRSTRGLTDQGEVLDFWGLDERKPLEGEVADFFPKAMEEVRFFSRIKNNDLTSADLAQERNLFVTRVDALPEGFRPSAEQVVWTPGFRTWRKLAALGIWVNGSSEALGESEAPRLEQLTSSASWVKLSHEDGVENGVMKLFSTYKLEPLDTLPNLEGVSHFFWTSYSSFELALKQHPAIERAFHACGPGHTATLIRKKLPDSGHLQIFLSYEEWRDAIRKHH